MYSHVYRLDDEMKCLWEFRSLRKLSYRRPELEARGHLDLVSKMI